MSNLRQHTAGFICLSTSLPESSVSRPSRSGAASMDAINLENSWECSTATLQCAFDTNSLGIMSLTLVVVDVRVCNPFSFLISLCSDVKFNNEMHSVHGICSGIARVMLVQCPQLACGHPKHRKATCELEDSMAIWQPSHLLPLFHDLFDNGAFVHACFILFFHLCL